MKKENSELGSILKPVAIAQHVSKGKCDIFRPQSFQ